MSTPTAALKPIAGPPRVGHKARVRHPERYALVNEWGQTFGYDPAARLYNWQSEGGERLSLPERELEIRGPIDTIPLSRCDVARWRRVTK